MNPNEQKPAAPAPVGPAPMPTASAGSRRKISKNMLIGIIVGAVLLAGIIAWAVYAIISNSPENLMKAAAQNLVKEKQVAGKVAITNESEPRANLNGDFAFVVDASNDKNSQFSFSIGKDSNRFNLKGLLLDKNAYFRLSGTENLATLYGSAEASPEAAVVTMLKNINDQWFELTEQDVKSLAGTVGGATAPPTSVSQDDFKRIMQIYDQHTFIKADQTFADEVVDGANPAHFSVKFDEQQYIAFLQAVKDANLTTAKVTDKDMQEAKEDAKKAAEEAKDYKFELWIARDSKKFKQLRVQNTKENDKTVMTLTFAGALPSLEKYEKPAGAKPISELMTTLIGPSINPVELNALQNSQSSELYLTQ